jgi:hypothetical protein
VVEYARLGSIVGVTLDPFAVLSAEALLPFAASPARMAAVGPFGLPRLRSTR